MTFDNCISLFSLPNLSKWTVIRKFDINEFIINCPSLCSLPDILNDSNKKFYDFGLFNTLNL